MVPYARASAAATTQQAYLQTLKLQLDQLQIVVQREVTQAGSVIAGEV